MRYFETLYELIAVKKIQAFLHGNNKNVLRKLLEDTVQCTLLLRKIVF